MLSRTALPILTFALLLAPLPGSAESAPDQPRPFTAAAVIGVRLIDEDLGFENDISLGARIGLGVSSRWSVLLDFVASHPVREVTGAMAAVDALRALARANILTGRVRPYLLAGIGGILFDFGDAPSMARGALTLGAGADFRIARKAFVFLEGSADGYQAGEVVYTLTGDAYLVEPQETHVLGTISLGVGAEF